MEIHIPRGVTQSMGIQDQNQFKKIGISYIKAKEQKIGKEQFLNMCRFGAKTKIEKSQFGESVKLIIIVMPVTLIAIFAQRIRQ